MAVGGKNFNRSFARVSPVFVALAFTFVPLCLLSATLVSATGTASVKRQAAGAQFARAEEQRAILNSKPANKRTLAEYKQVVSSYRRVYLITPHAVEVPEALRAAAELYTEMGDRFGRSYYQSAVDSYQFLIREYPKSRYCQEFAPASRSARSAGGAGALAERRCCGTGSRVHGALPGCGGIAEDARIHRANRHSARAADYRERVSRLHAGYHRS